MKNSLLLLTLAILLGSMFILGIPKMSTRAEMESAILNTVNISLPTLQVSPSQSVTVPVTVSSLTGLGVESFDLVFDFNPSVLSVTSVSNSGTISSGFTITPNLATPGRVTISGFGTQFLSGSGTLININFTVVGSAGSTSNLTWQSAVLNEGSPATNRSNGSVSTLSPCSYGIGTTSEAFGASGGTGSIAVTTSRTGCQWSATPNNSWIQITSGGTGSTSGTVNFSVPSNSGPARTGTIMVANSLVFTVTQASGCVNTLSANSVNISANASTGSFNVTSSDGACSWNATSDSQWITVTSGGSGTGSRTVGFSVAANSGPARSGTVSVGSSVFTINQASGCTYTISESAKSVDSASGSGTFSVSVGSGCQWTASSNSEFLTTTSSGTGNGTVSYQYAANNIAGVSRTGNISVGDKTFTLSQTACSVTLSPTGVSNVSPTGTTGDLSVSSTTGCNWSATPNDPWLNVTSGASGVGNGTVAYSVGSNSNQLRSGSISIGGQTFTVSQLSNCVRTRFANINAVSGSTITVPLGVENIANRGVISFDLTISFDPSVLEFQTVVSEGTASSGFTVSFNSTSPGVVNVSGFGVSQIVTEGALIGVRFLVKGAPQTSSNISISNLLFNEGTPCGESIGAIISAVGVSISGGVRYFESNGTPVNGVSLGMTGSATRAITTGVDGDFSFSNLLTGDYTVTPSKSGAFNGVTSFDAALIAQYSAGLIDLAPSARLAADVSGNGELNSFDAARIAQHLVGMQVESLIGNWVFSPQTRNYTAIVSDASNQEFLAVLMGDVSGSWVVPQSVTAENSASTPSNVSKSFRPSFFLVTEKSRGLKEDAGVSIPSAITLDDVSPIEVPIVLSNLSKKDITSFDLRIEYDSNWIRPADLRQLFSLGGVVANFSVTANSPEPGVLLISGFGTTPIASAGELLRIRFTPVEKGSVTKSESQVKGINLRNVLLNESKYEPLNGTMRLDD